MNEVYFDIEIDDQHYKVMLNNELIIENKSKLSEILEYHIKHAVRFK